MDPSTLILLALVSFITGALDASVGSGGLLLLPFLTLLGLPIKTAIGTTRLTFLMDSSAALLGHLRAGNVDLGSARPLLVTLGAGTVIGVSLTYYSPPELIRTVFALFIVLMALGLFVKVPVGRKKGGTVQGAGSFFIGVMIGMFGAGLGTVTIIFLTICGYRTMKAVGTSQVMIFFANVFAASGYLLTGQMDVRLGVLTGVFAAMGALAGVKVAVLVGEVRLKRMLFVVVLILAAKLLLG